MCGIVAGICHQAGEKVLDGLKRLEYRGYDSAGVAFWHHQKIHCIKSVGKICDLEKTLPQKWETSCCIGHTRWATHGSVTLENAHPQSSYDQRIYVVHNGVIENDEELRKKLTLSGISFTSQTDTELIADLISLTMKNTKNLLHAIEEVTHLLQGSYALAILSQDEPDKIYFARKQSPLLIGEGSEISMIASDLNAMDEGCEHFFTIPEDHYGYIEKNHVHLYHKKWKIKPTYFSYHIDKKQLEKGDYQHFMVKEIEEQPMVVQRILDHYVDNDHILLPPWMMQDIARAERIIFVACGTSYHACLIGKRWMEEFAKKPAEVHLASEFSYHFPIISSKICYIFLSQSGETADLKKALDQIRAHSTAPIFTLTNVSSSTLARYSDGYLELLAGPEISVASTKAYVAQLCLLLLMSLSFQQELSPSLLLRSCKESMEKTISQKEKILQIVKNKLYHAEHCFFIGRLYDYDLALEGALKMKEVSYIHAEGFAAGELKHGSIALIQTNTPVIACISSQKISSMTRINLQETISRGATPIVISTTSIAESKDDFVVDCLDERLSPIVMIPVLQYFAYDCAYLRKVDIDQPRNLAKSVTVE